MLKKRWYQSRTMQGVMVMVLGFLLKKLNIELGDAEIAEFAGTLLELIGFIRGAWGLRKAADEKGTYA
jgi:hypothetical protein